MPTPCHQLSTPLSHDAVVSLHAGDSVRLSGKLITARDAVHALLAEPDAVCPPTELNGAVIYHCGPIVVAAADGWQVVAAGPTTSSREEPYMATLIERYGIRGIIGKGGMGANTAAACRQFGCVYMQAVGGAAQLLAKTVQRVLAVHYLEKFGVPEAMWELEVCDFPAMVTIDSHGADLHADIRETSDNRLRELLTQM